MKKEKAQFDTLIEILSDAIFISKYTKRFDAPQINSPARNYLPGSDMYSVEEFFSFTLSI